AGSTRAAAIRPALVRGVGRGRGHRVELCNDSGLLPARSCSARQWRIESGAFWLGIRGPIWDRTHRQPVGTRDGHYPMVAYQAAFGLSIAVQATALLWFATPWLRAFVEHLYRSFVGQNTGYDSRAGFIAVPVDGPILQEYEQVEW